MTGFPTLDSFAAALLVIIGTVVFANIARAISRRLPNTRHVGLAQVVRELAPTATNLIYVIGLKLFVDVAPLSEGPARWLSAIAYVLTVLIVLNLIRRAAMMAIEWPALRSQTSDTLQKGFIPLFRNLVTLFVFFSGVIMVMRYFNYDVLSLLTALGVGSLAVGLAAKDTLSNMISGFTLIIDRNLHPGDRINLGGSVGDVEEIGLRSTRIKTGDGNTLIVPNAELVNTKILNLSLPSRAVGCSTQIRVPYSVPFQKVREICLSSIDSVAKRDRNHGTWVNLSSIGEGYQQISMGFWVAEVDHVGGAVSDLNEKLLQSLQKEGIALHAPQAQS